jgi:hypothetical protein
MQIKIKAGQYQDRFLFSEAKFPALIGGIGTGKTLALLAKIYKYCEDYAGSTALIVRKEFSDLKDSTMKDFEAYFNATVGVDKNYSLPNGSMIMFRHASEVAVLKNINLAIVGIEQAEEFETDEQFQYLRDRLRQKNDAKVTPLCIIANAQGHNWIWKLWINKADSIETIDEETGQRVYRREEYEAITANTFANEHNLRSDFIADQRRKAIDAPKHYAQYVMNSFEEMEQDDFVFNFEAVQAARARKFTYHGDGYGHRIIGYDIARYGNDKSAAVGIHQLGATAWQVFHVEQWGNTDLDATTGRILSISNNNRANDNIIDEDGIGAGPLDFIQKGRSRDDFRGFRNSGYSYSDNAFYGNQRTAAAFKLKEYIDKGWIAIPFDDVVEELMTLRFKFMSDGRRILVSKEEMRKQGYKSPNLADALMMAMSLIGDVKAAQDRFYMPQRTQYKERSLFEIARV